MHNYQTSPYPAALTRPALPRNAALLLAPNAGLALGLILLLALALRLWGIAFGLPYIIQPDEPSVEMRVLHMWLAGDPNPHYYVYPSFYYDLQALLAFAVAHAASLIQPDVLRHPLAHVPLFYLLGRGLTAILGTLTVLVVYLTGRIFSLRLGLIAALFLAVTAQHVQQSHYITVDAPTALFTALAALFALRALRAGRDATMRDIVLSAIAAGLAAGTKYNAGVALALPLAAIVLGEQARRWQLRAALTAVATCVATFVVTTPFALLDPPPFLNSLRVVARHYSAGHPGAEGNDNALWYLSYLAHDGMLAPLTALMLAGIIAVVVRYRRAGIVLLAFILPYYALLCSTYVRFDRNLLPLLPFAALLAATSADVLVSGLTSLVRNRTAAYLLVLGVAAVPSAVAASQADFAISHPFSEAVAATWANQHLPKGSRMATENWEGLAFSPTHFQIAHFGWLAQEPYDWFKSHGVRYLETDSYTDAAYLNAPLRYPVEAARYRAIYRRGLLIARFVGDPVTRPGPTITIYEVR